MVVRALTLIIVSPIRHQPHRRSLPTWPFWIGIQMGLPLARMKPRSGTPATGDVGRLDENSTLGTHLDSSVRIKMVLPITSTSIWVRKKQSSASVGPTYDGLVLIKRGVEHHRNAREAMEGLDQPIIARDWCVGRRSASGPNRRHA